MNKARPLSKLYCGGKLLRRYGARILMCWRVHSGSALRVSSHFPHHSEFGKRSTKKISGFTLIEVLLALAVIAIALTALVKATAQNVAGTQRIKEKMISHWIAMHGVSMIQLGLVKPPPNQEITQVTSMLGQRWYWRAKINPTAIKSLQEIRITLSKNQAGPFSDPLIAFRYQP